MNRLLLIGLYGLLTAGTSSGHTATAAPDALADATPINLYAVVASTDGYLNVRATPNGRESNVLSDIPNGEIVLVTHCESGTRGVRWCHIERTDAPVWSPEAVPAAGLSGYVFDKELIYRAPLERESLDHPAFADGVGIPRGFTVALQYGQIDYTMEGQTALRDRPSRSGTVLAELPNGAPFQTIACGPGAPDDRWCLAWSYDAAQLEEYGVERVADLIGYVHSGDLSVEGEETPFEAALPVGAAEVAAK